MSAWRHILVCAVLVTGPLDAAPIARVAALPEGARVIDIRAETACRDASLPGARCLPSAWLFDAEGGPIDFGALRWLLGTLGLDGSETVAVYPADAPDAAAAAALIHLAGQNAVILFGGPPGAARGETRSFSREAVYTAPMRLDALTLAATDTPLTTRLEAFAHGAADTVAFAPTD